MKRKTAEIIFLIWFTILVGVILGHLLPVEEGNLSGINLYAMMLWGWVVNGFFFLILGTTAILINTSQKFRNWVEKVKL